MIRVLIVDDSAFIRRMLERLLGEAAGIEVVGIAHNGEEAIEKAAELKPDIVTLDIEMPKMDGLTALPRIRRAARDHEPKVIMLSSLTTAGSREALRALSLGAADVLAKDGSARVDDQDTLKRKLVHVIRAIARPKPDTTAAGSTAPTAARSAATSRRAEQAIGEIAGRRFGVVAIASSTGGPPVLETLISRVPADCRVPIVIAQHMPKLFTESLAERLDELCPPKVVLAKNNTRLEPGTVYISEGGLQTTVKRVGATNLLQVGDEPEGELYKPSANVLFDSVAETFGSRTLGVVVTGMGDDGFEGAKTIKAKGGTIVAQTESTCVVYGMPKAVTEGNLTDATLDPEDLAETLARVCGAIPSGSSVQPPARGYGLTA